MRTIRNKQVQSQILLSALFMAALSFITLAASFAEAPAEQTSATAIFAE